MNWLSEHWPLVVAFLIPGLFGALVLWYQPEARHAPFATGQVWKNSAGFTMKITAIGQMHYADKCISLKRTTPEGRVDILSYYPEDAFRRLIIKNRYRLV